jgi:hypothetical protein
MPARLPALLATATLLVAAPQLIAQEGRGGLLAADRAEAAAAGHWIYNDLPKGFADAQRTGKPMLVVFR